MQVAFIDNQVQLRWTTWWLVMELTESSVRLPRGSSDDVYLHRFMIIVVWRGP